MGEYGWDQKTGAPVCRENGYMSVAERIETGGARLKKSIGDHLNTFSLLVLVILQIAVPFVTAGLRNPFTAEYLFSSMCNVASTLLAYYLFVPNGKHDRMRTESYLGAVTAHRAASERVRSEGLLSRFRTYCRVRARAEAAELFEGRLEALENAGVSREVFEEHYRSLGRRRLFAARYLHGALTGEQYRMVLLCRRTVAVRPISPNLLLTGAESARVSDSVRADSSFERRAMATKPLFCIASVLLQSIFELAGREELDPFVMITGIVIRVFLVCWASLAGYRTGLRIVLHRTADIENRTAFLHEFLEEIGEKP
ncbi:MAG: hypothetical protein E7663_03210 [Ruminococcaceae bacterium]|nr:hypothetical protein [Oscillospiraceae bacterium]